MTDQVTTATIAATPVTQLQPPFGPSVDSLCHPWFTTTNLSYSFPIFETSATALCGTTGIHLYHLWQSRLPADAMTDCNPATTLSMQQQVPPHTLSFFRKARWKWVQSRKIWAGEVGELSRRNDFFPPRYSTVSCLGSIKKPKWRNSSTKVCPWRDNPRKRCLRFESEGKIIAYNQSN